MPDTKSPLALAIAAKLGDERGSGAEVKCRCPLCGGRLALRDGERGLLAKCWGGCEPAEVYAELRHLGHLTGVMPAPLSAEEIAERDAAAERKRRRKIADALDVWSNGQRIEGTLADHYLRTARGIDVLSPFLAEAAASVVRFHPRCWHSSPSVHRPALVAKIEHAEHGFAGVHVTYLALDGSDKTTLDPPRKIFGACKGAAVRLSEPTPGRWFCIGEGIESTLSVMQSCALSGWAALSAIGIKNIILPPTARMVVICADHDRNGTGQRMAREAAHRFMAEARRVRIALPPLGSDFNDMLTAGAIEEMHHGAA
jgi:hypothetical protein